jgi:hypothetical protein
MMRNKWARIGAALVLTLTVVMPVAAVDFLYTWPASSASGLQGYEVYQSTGGGPYQFVAQIPVGSLANPQQPSYLVTGLQEGRTYYFASSAIAPSGNSPLSNQTCITVNGVVVDCNTDDDGNATVFISCFIGAAGRQR